MQWTKPVTKHKNSLELPGTATHSRSHVCLVGGPCWWCEVRSRSLREMGDLKQPVRDKSSRGGQLEHARVWGAGWWGAPHSRSASTSSVSEHCDLLRSHWQMALAYSTTSLSIHVRGSGNSTEPSKKPRWPPCRGSTNMTFSRFSAGERQLSESLSSDQLRGWRWESKLARAAQAFPRGEGVPSKWAYISIPSALFTSGGGRCILGGGRQDGEIEQVWE